jgi:uncharacterized protein YjdB/C1A family cysteine protease
MESLTMRTWRCYLELWDGQAASIGRAICKKNNLLSILLYNFSLIHGRLTMTIYALIGKNHRNSKKAMNACLAFALCFLSAPALLGQSNQGPAPRLQLAPLNPAFVKWLDAQKERKAHLAQGLPADPIALGQATDPYGRRFGYIPDPILPQVPNASLTQMEALVQAGLAVFQPIHDPRTWLPSGLPSGLSLPRNQNPYGTCWSFSSIAALEYALVKAGTSRELSEWHLAYFAYNPINGIPSFTKSPVDAGEHETFDQGGNFSIAQATMARGDLAGGPVPLFSSTYGGALPSPSTNSVATISKALLADTADKNAIKGLLNEYGVVAISMMWGDSKCNNNTWSFRYVQSGTTYTNHGVNIVGWDDNWSKTKFPTGNQPSTDGAWIVRNSWGTGWGDGGYFYMSYDTSIFSIGVYSGFVGADAKTYQYDMHGRTGWIGDGNNTGWSSNIFTASADHLIKAVAFYTNGPGATYEIYIKKGVGSSPANGTLVFGPQSGALGSPGYYRIDLNSPVSVGIGEKFAVIIKLVDSSNYPLNISHAIADYTDSATATPGVGWISNNGSLWQDVTTIPNASTASVCLKAFADVGTAVPVESVSLNKPSTTLAVGATETLTATVLPSNATNKTVNWASSNTSIATVSSSGLVHGVAAGTATITATTQDGGKSATCDVTVNEVPVSGVTLNKTSTALSVGDSETLVANVQPPSATNKNFIWTSDNMSIATVSTNGLVSAIAVGTATITATSQADNDKSASCVVTVNPAIVVSVSPKTVFLQPNGTQTFTATVTGSPNTAVTWSVPAGQGTITPTGGFYTAPSTLGTYTVRATSQADTNKSDSATVTVIPASIMLINIPKALFVNDTAQLQADAYGLTNPAVTWSVPPGQGTITQAGLYTAPATISASNEKAVITATSVQMPDISDQAWILIRPMDFAKFGGDNNAKTSPQLLDLANAFGSKKTDPDGKYDPKYDINDDGFIDDDDLEMLFKVMEWRK